MIQGAVIGLIVGLIFTLITARKRKGKSLEVYRTFQTGGLSAARPVLDSWVPPIAGTVRTQDVPQTLERVAALGMIGDLSAVEREIGSAAGKLPVVIQIQAIGWLALVTQADDIDAAVAGLQATSERINTEGGALLKLVKVNTANMAAVAVEVAGGPAAPEARNKLASYAGQMGPFTKPLIYAFLAKAARASGDKPMVDRFHARAAAATHKLKGER